ncbi:hypothetical protein GCM10007877_09940 [Marinibactrum halimedae]|uniref:Uncharacterized protein n=1 Tax=Marinibactrum halimedae TaxID=1444977 RepID=A0AA37WLQ1_9GAMM|nr:hypothetical protein GCM10007877_09940 [Marinibactrum halimedae]
MPTESLALLANNILFLDSLCLDTGSIAHEVRNIILNIMTMEIDLREYAFLHPLTKNIFGDSFKVTITPPSIFIFIITIYVVHPYKGQYAMLLETTSREQSIADD